MTQIADSVDHAAVLHRALSAVKDLRARLVAAERAGTEPIAIVGIGCRFPGGVHDPASFWRLLTDGVDAIGKVPADRWDAEAYYDPDPQAAGKITTQHGGFLRDVDRFDAAFFRIAPREAVHLDPQHRLLLEVAWEALERAGETRESLDGSRTGVFVGITTNDYAQIVRRAGLAAFDAYVPTGTAHNAAAGRLSYLFGLQGPSVAVDAACASSLVAVHLACQSLRAGDCQLALAGGVNLILEPDAHIAMSRAHALAPDGRCKTFDASADGYGRGEGCGVVVLKRLSLAIADGDPILAVVRGSAVMQDGHSGGLTVPNGAAQQAVIRAALDHAGVAPGSVDYVEAHGTGTSLGDPIEVRALGAVFGEGRRPEHPLILGSVKTNIGHLESAAGVAGLVKVVLALQHRQIPPHLHLRELNPDIAQESTPKLFPAVTIPWIHDGPRLAGVSAFGLSGTIAHVVVEEAPPMAEPVMPADAAPDATTDATTNAADHAVVLPISAHTAAALHEIAGAYQQQLACPDAAPLRDLAYSAAVRRTHHDHRLAVVGSTHAELAAGLAAFLADEEVSNDAVAPLGDTAEVASPRATIPYRLSPATATDRSKEQPRTSVVAGIRAAAAPHNLVFVFPGQGGQWAGMAQDLLAREPVFAAAIATCDAALRPHLGWSLRALLAAHPVRSLDAHPVPPLDRIDAIQPALFAIQVALAALWRSFGIEPHAVVGHSMGEVAAAHVAGILTLDDAARIIAHRSRLLATIAGRGAMAVVELSLTDARHALAGRDHLLAVAASNAPSTSVVSGDPAALAALLDELARRDVFCRPINVDVASHSPQVDPLCPDLAAALADLRPSPATIAFHSTVSAALIDGRQLDAAYWVQNLRQPVLFAPVVDHLVAHGHHLFVELSPHPVLASSLQQILRRHGGAGAVLPSLRRDEPGRATMLGALAALYTAGYPVPWPRLFPSPRRLVALPAYPWQRERFWVDAPAPSAQPSGRRSASPAAPLLGDRLRSPALDDAVFESEVSLAALPFLTDHRIDHEVVVPGASHLIRLLHAAEQLHGAAPCTVENVSFPAALVLPASEVRTAQLIVDREGAFRTLTARVGTEADESAWVIHAAGRLRREVDAALPSVAAGSLDDIRRRCPDHTSGTAFYDEMSRAGYHLGPSFQWIEAIHYRDGEALGQMRAPRTRDEADGHPLHPGLLDSCFQLIAATSRSNSPAALAETGALYVPVAVTHLRFHRRTGAAPVFCHVRLGDSRDGEIAAELRVLDDQGPVAEIGFRGKRVDRERFVRGPRPARDLVYQRQWQRAEAVAQPAGSPRRYLLLCDSGGVGARLAARLEAHGARCMQVTSAWLRDPAAVRRVVDDALAGEPPLASIVHLGSLDATPAPATTLGSLDAARAQGCVSVLHVVQALARAAPHNAPRLHLVTAGVHAVAGARAVSPAQAPVWGLARVIAHEHPELRCTCIDLGPTPSTAELTALADELTGDDREDQVALRGATRHVARLVPHPTTDAAASTPPAAATLPAGDQPFRLEIDAPGVLEDLVLRAVPRVPPGPGEVEIEVRAAGINFVDVLSALGIRPDHTEGRTQLGGECAGVITRVGDAVTQLAPGDAVIAALAPDCFASFVTVPSPFVVAKPARLGFEDAATLPITFMTAHWAMHHKAHLQPGERILIHAAAGGVGLAAVQLARAAGAEIFATAGTEDKRRYLRELGIAHVMDSRSCRFADEIRACTGGQGVDVVLNCLTGEAVAASLGVLRAHGRFLEIGKRDIYEDHKLGLYPFHQNLSYAAIDLIRMFGDRPERFAALLREVVGLVAAGTIAPLPWRAFPVSQAPAAFRHIARAQHIGKVVLTCPDPDARLSPPVATPAGTFRGDASYLITGGLGGLGLAVASWMVKQGARHLALAGRRAPDATALAAIAALEHAGAQVLVCSADVARRDDVDRLLTAIDRALPPLRGVVHAAGLLDDGVLLQQAADRFAAVMAPKVAGSWNLHEATRGLALDFFVLFSGAGSLLGSPGQGNYAAANAFLDALAESRRAEGLPAQSIAWGPWSGVGLAARADRGGRLALGGVASLSPAEGVEALGRVMQDGAAQIAVLALDVRKCFASYPALADAPLWAALAPEPSKSPAPVAEPAFRRTLSALAPAERRGALERHLRDHAARVLGLAPARIAVEQPLGDLGFDSLMTLELRHRIEASLGLALSATVLWNYPTITALAEHLIHKLALAPDVAIAAPPDPAARPDLTGAVQALTEDQAIAALAATLGQLEELRMP